MLHGLMRKRARVILFHQVCSSRNFIKFSSSFLHGIVLLFFLKMGSIVRDSAVQ